MGLTERQILWRVELPLATPEIVAGLRIATVSTVAIATLAVLRQRRRARGEDLRAAATSHFATSIIIAGGIAILMAIAFDVILVGIQRLATPWRRAAAVMIGALLPLLPARPRSAARSNSSSSRRARASPAARRSAASTQVVELTLTQLELTLLALALALIVALPIGLYLGHRGTGELLGDRRSATPAGRFPSWR